MGSRKAGAALPSVGLRAGADGVARGAGPAAPRGGEGRAPHAVHPATRLFVLPEACKNKPLAYSVMRQRLPARRWSAYHADRQRNFRE